MAKPSVVIAHDPSPDIRSLYSDVLSAHGDLVFLPDLSSDQRKDALRGADAMICYNPRLELDDEDARNLESIGFVQLLTAGVDHVPMQLFPATIPVSSNAGAFGESMAEHAVAMIMAAAKRLPFEHQEMRDGRFNQFVPTKGLRGSVCAILGFGGAGRATARLLRPMGVTIKAINRSGKTEEPVDFIGTSDDLEYVMRGADFVVITLSLIESTQGLIGERELGWLAEDAILVNVARGEIVDQDALYRHLVGNPRFFACLEAWWIEPVRHGEFRLDHPFLELPNVIAAPHNSASTAGSQVQSIRRGAENMRRWLMGKNPENLLGDAERTF